MADFEDGVWRTMDNGQKIFIRKGESFKSAYKRKLSMKKGKKYQITDVERSKYEESEVQRRKKEVEDRGGLSHWNKEQTKQAEDKVRSLKREGKTKEADEVQEDIYRNAYHEDTLSRGEKKLKNIMRKRELTTQQQKLEKEYSSLMHKKYGGEGSEIEHEGRKIGYHTSKGRQLSDADEERLETLQTRIEDIKDELAKLRR